MKKVRKRPLLRYHGGKWMLSNWIIENLPEHKVYVEPYGGAASVLIKKERSYAEVYNDLDDNIVNLFNIVRDRGNELKELLIKTPFSRKEFELSYLPAADEMEMARRTVVRSFQGFGSASVTFYKTGFRSNAFRSGSTPAIDWMNYPKALELIIERLQGVIIESRPALKVIDQYDKEETFFYVDPPYKKDTRCIHNTKSYRFEMEDYEHEELLNVNSG